MSLSPETKKAIESIIESDKVVLFMKGNRDQPQCGFSAKVVRILDQLVEDYTTFDVLSEPNIREGIKEFASWPTIPQLYISKEFMGGCDIVSEMFESSELHKALGLDAIEVEKPKLDISEAALAALKDAFEQADNDDAVRITVDARYEHGMEFDAPRKGDVIVEADGIRLLFDPMSARRAQNLKLDYEESSLGKGFQITNPQKK